MASISGLTSGLDTATIVDQLMTLEAAPQTRLKSRAMAATATVTNLQLVNSRINTLVSKATTLGESATWSAMKATSSSDKVAATITAGSTSAPTGSLSFSVLSHAATQQNTYSQAVPSLDTAILNPGETLTLTRAGDTTTISAGTGTLRDLLANLNATETGLTAVAISDNSGFHLRVSSRNTGESQAFTLTPDSGSPLLGTLTTTPARDARIDLGGGLVASSSTNSFANLLSAMSLTLATDAPLGTPMTITVARDTAAIAKNITETVEALNTALKALAENTAYNATTKTAGALSGEASVRAASNALINSVLPAGVATLAPYGIQLTRQGTVSLDQAKLTAALASDPAAVQAALGSEGLAGRLKAAADPYSRSDGILSNSINSYNRQVKDLNNNVSAWDLRLNLKRASLVKQFSSLETSLNQLSARSSWLSNQLSALNR